MPIVKTVKTVIFQATGSSEGGKFTRQTKRAPEGLWLKVGGVEGMKAWLQKRDPRFAVDPDVQFQRYEDIDPEDMRRPPVEVPRRDD